MRYVPQRPEMNRAQRLSQMVRLLGAGFAATALAMMALHGDSSNSRGHAFLTATPAGQVPMVQQATIGRPADMAASSTAELAFESQPERSGSLVSGASLCTFLVAAVVIRDVAMYGASPKSKRAKWRTKAHKENWYRTGERAARRALWLGRGIKEGTIDFIYGKPQDEDEYDDDDDLDDDEYDDDDDDEALEKKSLS